MKKTSSIKEALLQVTFVTTIFLITSCNNHNDNDAAYNNNKKERDVEFLVNAAEINLEQIKLGKLAQQIGRTTHVQELGKIMEDAHTKSRNDLTALAKSKRIAIPTSPTHHAKDVYKILNEKGNDFDKAYADRMVSSNQDAIESFEIASVDSYNPDIKNWAKVSLPDLRIHLDHSIVCQKKCDSR
ncbi:MAG: DUF4142 domain-containing protein [Bacteroidales bacterium]